MQERLRRHSELLAEAVPVELVLDEFDLAALRLSKEAPDQFQQYDRLRSEAEFRNVLWAPLLVIGLAIGIPQEAAVGAAVVIVSGLIAAMLIRQAWGESRNAQELLASAIYFEMTTTPLLETLISEYKADEAEYQSLEWEGTTEEVNKTDRDLAWLLNFLSPRGLLDVYNKPLAVLKHPSGGPNRWPVVAERLSPSTRFIVTSRLGLSWEPESGQVNDDEREPSETESRLSQES